MTYKVPNGDGGKVSARPVLPGQNYGDWRHHTTGKLGVYSNWSLQSSTHLLADAPLRDHVPGTGRHPNDVLMSQIFTGEQRYAPMELAKFSHGGQDAPYLRHAHWEYHGVPASEVFHAGTWGYTTEEALDRVFTFSRHSNWWFYGVTSADATFDGRPRRFWDSADLPSYARLHEPFVFKGVGEDRLEDSGETLAVKVVRAQTSNEFAFQRTNEWQGVTSAKAL